MLQGKNQQWAKHGWKVIQKHSELDRTSWNIIHSLPLIISL